MRSYLLQKPRRRSRWTAVLYPALLLGLLVSLALSGHSWEFHAHDFVGQPDYDCPVCQHHKIASLGFEFSAAISSPVFSGQVEVAPEPIAPRTFPGSRTPRGPPA